MYFLFAELLIYWTPIGGELRFIIFVGSFSRILLPHQNWIFEIHAVFAVKFSENWIFTHLISSFISFCPHYIQAQH